MTPEIQNHPDGRTLFIARSDDGDGDGANDREVQFILPPGRYIRSSVSIGAYKNAQPVPCTLETLEADGETWRKGIRARLSGTVHIRMKDNGDRREITIHTTLEDPRGDEETVST